MAEAQLSRYRKRKFSPGSRTENSVLLKITPLDPSPLPQQVNEATGAPVVGILFAKVGAPEKALFYELPYDPHNGFRRTEQALDHLELPDEVKGKEVKMELYDIQLLALLFKKSFIDSEHLAEVVRANLQMVAEEDADMPVI